MTLPLALSAAIGAPTSVWHLRHKGRGASNTRDVKPTAPSPRARLRGVLLFVGGPLAVVWLVVAVVVDAIQGCALGTWSHVGQERVEIVAPSVAHSDSASAVSWKSWGARLFASADSRQPATVFTRPRFTASVAVFRELLDTQTTARLRLAAHQSLRGGETNIAAVALHSPLPDTTDFPFSYNYSSSEAAAIQHKMRGHFANYTPEVA